MIATLVPPTWSTRFEWAPRAIIGAAGAVLVVGPAACAAWWQTGNDVWIQGFFSYAGALFLVACSAIGTALSYVVWRQFSKGELLRPAWFLIFLSGLCQLLGGVGGHILANRSLINPLTYLPLEQGTRVMQRADVFAQLLGPLYMALLACGLFYVLAACRRNGVLANLRLPDFILLGIVTAYTTHYFATVVVNASSMDSQVHRFTAWTSDPLLCVLLLEAILILRSAANMGWGLIPRCWVAFTAAIFLTSLGDMGLWAWANGYLSPAMVALSWHIWFVAGVCFALGPAYQLQAIAQASRGHLLDDVAAPMQGFAGESAHTQA
jgi:hypothetical protein